MLSATKEHSATGAPLSTPTRRSALGFSTAALFAGLTVPAIAGATTVLSAMPTPIAVLQRRLSELTERRDAMDEALIEMAAGSERAALHEAFGKSLDDYLALQDEIATLPAENLEDAAIQVAIGYYRAEDLNSYTLPEELDGLSKELRFLQASVLLAIVKAAGLDIGRFGWGDMRRLCVAHGPRGRVAA
jgi:hypothetical protein